MRTKLVSLCLIVCIAGSISAHARGSMHDRSRVIYYSQMMIKLDGTIVATQDNGASWTWTAPPSKETEVQTKTVPKIVANTEMVIVSDLLGNIMFQGSKDEWRDGRNDPSLYGALLIVTKHLNGVSTTERVVRTK